MWTAIVKGGAALLFKLLGGGILEPILAAWGKHENVDLEKFKTSSKTTAEVAKVAIQANADALPHRIGYLFSILNWWPFRYLLLWLLFVSAVNFTGVILDSTPFYVPLFMDEAHKVGSWGVTKPPAPYDEYQREFLLFFIVGTPAAGVAGGVLALLGKYLARK